MNQTLSNIKVNTTPEPKTMIIPSPVFMAVITGDSFLPFRLNKLQTPCEGAATQV